MKPVLLAVLLAVLASNPAWAGAPGKACAPAVRQWLDDGDASVLAEKYEQALALFGDSLAACRRAGDRAGISASLLGYGQVLVLLNRFADSEQALLEGWALRQQLDDGDPGKEAIYYPSELMYLYRQSGRFELAWQWGEKALQAKARLIGVDTISYGTSLSNLYGVALQTKEYARGLPYARQAMEIWGRLSGVDSTDHAWGMRDVGALLLRMGRLDEAFGYLDRAYRIRLRAFGENRTETQTSIADMAAWHVAAGDDRDALAFAQKALANARARYGPAALETAVGLARVSAIELRLGEASQAHDSAEASLAIRRTVLGDGHAQAVYSWQETAIAALANNRLGRAELAAATALRHCRSVFANTPATCAALQVTHGKVLLALGQAQDALDAANGAAQLAAAPGAAPSGDESAALMLAAQAWRALGQPARAADTLAALAERIEAGAAAPASALDEVRQALLLTRAERPGIGAGELAGLAQQASALARRQAEARGPSHPVHGSALLDAAAIGVRGGQPAARQQAARALAIALANGDSLLEARAAAQLSAFESGSAAVFFGKQAVNALQATRAGTTSLPAVLQQSFVRQKRAAYTGLADHLLDRHRIHEAETVLAMVREDEFHSLVRSGPDPRSTRLGFTGAEGRLRLAFEGQGAALRQGAQALAQARIRQAQGAANGDAALDAANAAMSALLDSATDALTRLPAALAQAPAASAAPDQAALPAGSLRLSYLVTGKRLRIVAQHGRSATVHNVAIDERLLARQIAHLRQSAQDPGKDPRGAAQALYALLLRPVQAQLARARTLSVSLDGVLRYLPFAMLHDGRHWLVERLPVSLSYNGGNGAAPAAAPRAPGMALFGQTQASGELPALPWVGPELLAVKAAERGAGVASHIYLDQAFTADALQQALSTHSVVHIASHFVLRSGLGHDSYMLMGDGRALTLAELGDQRFRFAGLDLLTLSACETAVPAGTDDTGRELEGLAWLARQRGARNVLASLWRVSDQSTAALMGDFYAALGQGKTKAQALRVAQVRQIRSRQAPVSAARGLKALDAPPPSGGRSHPFYWAGFTLLGG